ncbi:hypothetical protein BIV57_12915 [Mangrovactinospora gilvigrisea]|uniref:Uncharacterized protein n=1 Tax=Mangrovactinospora gilvigrisea TaxID=1428644 RepID=A0A1J7BEK0_9ACTN|nr:hypothetical protein [Mangrovactinospora gilvigrisea]OIV37062.1 hypothetical protein BIV57_12915 [Mangrovactinospora gilvigrisea]
MENNEERGDLEGVLHAARALVHADLEATGVCEAPVVSLLEEAVRHRRWWVEQWPQGAEFLAGLVAQDMQDALLERYGRWPVCPLHAEDGGAADLHPLSVEPELGPDPRWVCGTTGREVAAVGSLADADVR